MHTRTMFCRIPQWLNAVLLLINLLFLLLMFVNLKRYDENIIHNIPGLVRVTPAVQLVKLGPLQPDIISTQTNKSIHSKDGHSNRGSYSNQTIVSQDGHPKRRWNYDWDGRHSRWQSRNQNVVNREIFLIRHGQYYTDRGPSNTNLTELGKLQAEKTGQRLRDMGMIFTRFLASTSMRAQGTAQIIHKYIPYLSVENSDLLREGWPTFPDPKIPIWDPSHPGFKMDGERIFKAFSKYFHRADPSQTKESTELIVAHGNVIAYFILRLLQLDRERWIRLMVHQCSITRLWIHPDGLVTIKAVGDVGHLPKYQWT